MSFTSAFTYAFQDKRWPYKLGGLILLGCIPGLNVLAWVGYQQSIAGNIAHRQPIALPAWDDWADILVRGLIAVSASGLYWLPVGLFALLGLFPVTRLSMLFAFIAAVGLGLALSVGHVRFACSDRPGTYGLANWRDPGSNRRVPPNAYLLGFLAQTAVIALAVLLTPIALFTLIGPVIIWSSVSVINGYIVGQIALRSTARTSQIDKLRAASATH